MQYFINTSIASTVNEKIKQNVSNAYFFDAFITQIIDILEFTHFSRGTQGNVIASSCHEFKLLHLAILRTILKTKPLLVLYS
jgi:hypothetical protein